MILTFAAVLTLVAPAGLASESPRTERRAALMPAHETASALNPVVEEYCVVCHNAQLLPGNLTLEQFEVQAAGRNAEVAERMIRKLRAGMMPPPGMRRPDEETTLALVEALEQGTDEAAARSPNPGLRSFQRLNRAEYARAIRELLDLEVDAGSWLPPDPLLANFDNMADAQTLSPTLLEAYLNAASAISRMAIGDRNPPVVDHNYTNSQYLSQHPWDHVEGAPYGTRGGMVVDHVFPVDGEYVFGLGFSSGNNSRLDDVDLSLDGERIALVLFDPNRDGVGADGRGDFPTKTAPVFIRAGQHRLAAAFIRRSEGPYEDLIRPHGWSYAGGGSGGTGVTTLPHLRDLTISGPYKVTGISETASRRRIFSCRPTLPDEERSCARRIIERLAAEAYRRPPAAGDLEGLMNFYELGAARGGFEIGVRTALEAMLSSPYFILRLERAANDAASGRDVRVSDLDLASRLSFFLWGAPPDAELLQLAGQGRLSAPAELERQARRLLGDRRAEALATRFAAQWFRLQDLYKVRPDPNFYPNFDENLARAMQRETELLFHYLVREDRSLLELFTADYTFVNERLALHYGFSKVAGAHFRRVSYPDETRRGILGHGSVLVLTSLANRTSPVLRGKWVMEVLMGTPPPPPPPDVPDLDETEAAQDGKMLTTRERMEMHRANPACRSCHRFMDPIGLALDNFDVTARWRVREHGVPLDTRGDFYDGTPVSTPAELVAALMKRPVPLVRTFTENLMAYALGRRVEYYDQPAIRAIARDAQANEYRMSSFILGVIQSPAFQLKRTAADDTTADGPR